MIFSYNVTGYNSKSCGAKHIITTVRKWRVYSGGYEIVEWLCFTSNYHWGLPVPNYLCVINTILLVVPANSTHVSYIIIIYTYVYLVLLMLRTHEKLILRIDVVVILMYCDEIPMSSTCISKLLRSTILGKIVESGTRHCQLSFGSSFI